MYSAMSCLKDRFNQKTIQEFNTVLCFWLYMQDYVQYLNMQFTGAVLLFVLKLPQSSSGRKRAKYQIIISAAEFDSFYQIYINSISEQTLIWITLWDYTTDYLESEQSTQKVEQMEEKQEKEEETELKVKNIVNYSRENCKQQRSCCHFQEAAYVFVSVQVGLHLQLLCEEA